MTKRITAAMLYDAIRCPHRVTLDLFGAPADRDQITAFVQLLWDRGYAYEQEIIRGLNVPFANLSSLSGDEKEAATLDAINRGDALVYSGRITAMDLVGEPDLLRREGLGYVAGDIKSGAGLEGANEDSDGRPKKHYAVQLALYTEILEGIGVSAGRTPFVWDIHADEVRYDLDSPQGQRKPESLWDSYQKILDLVRAIVSGRHHTLPALMSDCKLCHWRTLCKKHVREAGDLTLIPELGRATRDAMVSTIPTIDDLARADIGTWTKGKKTVFPGIGPDSLRKFQTRARLLTHPDAKPYVVHPVDLPPANTELFFDIETDPMRNICYLHGFVERKNSGDPAERYHSFLATSPTPEEEERAFAEAWAYIRSRRPCTIYYYSKYERTWWRQLQQRHPAVATQQDIEAIFDRSVSVDLYFDLQGCIEWPTNDYSVKTLATYLGFTWRDQEPSGAASIEWYHRWVESGDPAIRQRILDYNEDDCLAMRVLLDGVRALTAG
ncbi:TM0106 family RecB-like putative nuclease [Anaerobaca lacustris]|uniref:TM0106 family RecB-like putative nuclease n=1 Tax=Anaerobaca lacustris TaxID=3044600 RepID=A0AAW6U4I0_9BACT|nr:TM0106 family RecB-like putative nuclease [Sedimentisphaerales bacterium M17dextr]